MTYTVSSGTLNPTQQQQTDQIHYCATFGHDKQLSIIIKDDVATFMCNNFFAFLLATVLFCMEITLDMKTPQIITFVIFMF